MCNRNGSFLMNCQELATSFIQESDRHQVLRPEQPAPAHKVFYSERLHGLDMIV